MYIDINSKTPLAQACTGFYLTIINKAISFRLRKKWLTAKWRKLSTINSIFDKYVFLALANVSETLVSIRHFQNHYALDREFVYTFTFRMYTGICFCCQCSIFSSSDVRIRFLILKSVSTGERLNSKHGNYFRLFLVLFQVTLSRKMYWKCEIVLAA